jgi:predicted phage tail protein
MIVNWFDENFLLASMIWGSVATGYLVYGWKQKAVIPLVGGAAMMAVAFLISSAWLMSLACIAVMAIVYWLAKQGY